MIETKVCKECGKELPIINFQINNLKGYKPYHISTCNRCRYLKRAEAKNRLSDNIEIIYDRRYKEAKPERILDIDSIGIIPYGTDEKFVKLMDFKDAWLSNYGRVIRFSNGKYRLLQGSYDKAGALRYTLIKTVFYDGKWAYNRTVLYAAKAVGQEFIVNPDIKNNIYIWHSGQDKQDCYYRNLYPLNREQYRIVKNHYVKTGDDSESFILKVMNDINFKPDEWSRRSMKPVMCGIGYRGSEDIDCKSDAYIRWHDMMNRCYNEKFHERQPQYKKCSVCEEWLNFSNFKVWYEENKYGDEPFDLDKDILFKGNTVYSPETCCLVPHIINTVFLNGKQNRGDLPIGVWYEKDKKYFRSSMSFLGKQIKLGTFKTVEQAFIRYKEYKEEFIQDLAEQYKGKIPQKVYEAMVKWEIDISD